MPTSLIRKLPAFRLYGLYNPSVRDKLDIFRRPDSPTHANTHNYAIAILVASTCSFYGCSPSDPGAKTMIIHDVGHHTRGAFSLDIKKDKDLVKLSVADVKSNREIFSTDIGNAFSRWYILCGDKGAIWVYSGDVGTSCWVINKDLSFIRTAANESNHHLISEMPSTFYDQLPRVLKQRWSKFRKSEVEIKDEEEKQR